jgi:hypothetical protein
MSHQNSMKHLASVDLNVASLLELVMELDEQSEESLSGGSSNSGQFGIRYPVIVKPDSGLLAHELTHVTQQAGARP